MKTIYYSILGLLTLVLATSCSDYLENTPNAVLEENELINPDNIDGFVTAAYAALGNDHYDSPFSLWPYGNVRSDDAYKGGSGPNDIQVFHFFEVSNNIRTDFGELDRFWYNSYIAISRVNKALNALDQIDKSDYPLKDVRIAEMHFLRGHFYFMLKEMFKYVPYITEDIPIEEYGNISNRELSNDGLWEAIAQDFESAAENLPANQDQIGRVNSAAAYAYLAKVRLYQAYEQDENNNVVKINQEKLQEVIQATDEVVGKYQLEDDFGFNFLPGSYQNGSESVFSIQFSNNDNTLHGRLNYSDVLSTPQGLGCCDFQKPSQNLVNAFKTNSDGLPLLDDFNDSDLDYNNLNATTVDPRLYHTVAIPGLPYKYNNSYIYQESWNRSPSTYGFYASLKENVSPDCDCFVNIDPFYGNSKNRIEIRYADVLLMRAEALIELGRHKEALPLVNQIRQRAGQSTTLINGYANNTQVALYEDGVNCNWTQDFARKAMRFERRLEFAMEGNRFFDLVRWGVADEVLNKYYEGEKEKRVYYEEAHFDPNLEEYCPIPLAQINFSRNVYKQNTGY
ncbi:RagB/SusD family nutrient uptake outer membrane protein [Galbibacter pacificus]|uniref:RagB/SusD family nutrient uptake outer membrane protein n=1 Tax=Galbibacter pacificus TaxID=2996052 RepID=A0ABT6FMU6_9FLAO|nr:RagB/SusD family nutrient uptake outer membrane protein [Galbibacter pacificus]MDG3581102.1 RagB/SusD family nutrient uptake outer membrane protein [Galbibacter pacificus]MDG3584580.1 RagB/SusD family nutrient uptake outer membrane protein [Galbibacter pacificus]